MSEVFVVDGVRTPLGRHRGALADIRPDDLAALVFKEVVRRAGVPGDAVDEVILGAANQAGEDNRNVARMAALLAGLPYGVPGYTVNRLCASGLTAVASAAQAIRSGEADIVVAGGVESMTRAPWVMAKPGTPWAKPGQVADTALGWRFTNSRFTEARPADPGDGSYGIPAKLGKDAGHAGNTTTGHLGQAGSSGGQGIGRGAAPAMVKIDISMGETAEEVAALDGITRAESDAFALRSHQRACAAAAAGRFDAEIVPVPTRGGEVLRDEGPRADTSLEKLAKLRTSFRDGGIVTAGSSSPLSDGAAAVVVASEDAVRRHGLTARARIVTAASAGVRPDLMGLGPVPATRKVLARAGWDVADLDAIELNEAFAVQALAVMRRLKLDEEKVNADGGAIALGHPLGCSGARIVVTLLGRLERADARRGLATMCVGVGQGVAMLVERL
jgi:acetyl-CoA acetyltransferase family protein